VDLPGLHEEMASFVSAWGGEEPVQLAQMDRMQEKEKEKCEKERSKQEERRRQESLNIGGQLLKELKELKEHEKEFRWERADKGGGGVVISRKRWKEEVRKHVADETAYVPAGRFSESLQEEGEGEARYWAGSPDPIEAVIGWQPRQWRSTRDFLVEGRRGNFETEKDQIASLYERMEYFLAKMHAGKLPDSIVADLLGREMK